MKAKSVLIYISLGCRQGDPISSSLFICVEIIGIMIRQNRHIKGILIQKNFVCFNIRIIQLCFLDGTEKILKSALDLLFQFSKFSWLDAKAQGHWIGSKIREQGYFVLQF